MSETVTVETINTPVSTDSNPVRANANPEVSQVIKSVKPYDDLDAYGDESQTDADAQGNDKGNTGNSTGDNAKSESDDGTDTAKNPQETKIEGDKSETAKLEESTVKRTINGKEVEFKVADAIKAYESQENFNRSMDKRLQEADSRDRLISNKFKSWDHQQANFKSKIGEVIEVAQNGDFVSGIRALAKLAAGSSDLDVVKFEEMYFGQLEEVRKVYSEMTPEQRKAYWATRRATEAESKVKKFESEKEATVSQSQLQEEVTQLQQANGISPQEFWGNYKKIADEQVGPDKHFKSADDITKEDVIGYSLEVKHWENIYSAAETLGIEDEALLDEVAKITKTKPGITVEEIQTVIKGAGLASPSAVENLNRKVGKSGQPSSAASSTKKQNANGMDKEDLDFLYRNQPKAYQRIIR